jgi:hypothetical protein
MLDHVDARFHRHLGVDGLAVARHLQAEAMRLVYCGLDFVRREVAGDLDDAGPFLKVSRTAARQASAPFRSQA